MIEFRFCGIRIRFCFGFFAVTALMLAEGDRTPLAVLMLCLLHEGGHFLFMKLFGLKTAMIQFYGGGIKITSTRPPEQLGFIRELLVLSGGCAANFLYFLMTLLLSHSGGELLLSGYISLALGLFSALPFSTLDGGRILSAVVSRFGSMDDEYRLERIMKITDICGGAALAALFAMRGSFNFTLPLTLAFIIGGSLADSEFVRFGRRRRVDRSA
ncbi:MAG: hypothetical protein ACI4JJ_07085 [Huintestinicola sp.]